MRLINKYKGWGIYRNNTREVKKYSFNITVLHPDNMEYYYMCTPADSDWEVNTLEAAISWIDNY